MTDTEITAILYSLEQRIHQLEQKIKHMPDVGDVIEVEELLYGDVYEIKSLSIAGVTKAHEP